jgi:anthranilate phosphoribosyltransferase
MDEVALSSNTTVLEVDEGGMIRSYSVSPQELGFEHQPLSSIQGGQKEANAEIALRVLRKEPGPSRNVVIANAAFGLYVSGKAETVQEGKAMAAESIDSGRAFQKLNKLIEHSNRP